MPKKRKKKRAKRNTASLPPAKTQGPVLSPQAPAPARTWQRALYENRAEGMERFIRFFPLFSGAWVAGGLLLDDILSFAALSLLILLAFFAVRIRRRDDIAFRSILEMLLYAGILGSCLLLYAFTTSLLFCGLAGLAAVLSVTSELLLGSRKGVQILVRCLARVGEMSLYSLLSVLSQGIADDARFYWEYTALGFVPGSCLAAAMFLREIEVFEKSGWKRSRAGATEGRRRPAALAQWYSFLLLIGPALPVVLVPLGRFPAPFLLLAFAFVPIPRLCQSFLERSRPDSLLFIHTIHVALGLSVGAMLVAVLARFFG